MKINNRLIILGIFLTLLSSCQKENPEPLTSQALIPLHNGNKWTYQLTRYNNSGEQVSTIETKIGSKITIRGHEGFFISNASRPFNATFLGQNDGKGNFISLGGFSDVDTLIIPSVQFKAKAQPGDHWDFHNISFNYNDGTFNDKTIAVSCLSTDTMKTTPKGNFRCRVSAQSPNSGENLFKYYISENIGIVQTENYELGKLFSRSELISYELSSE